MNPEIEAARALVEPFERCVLEAYPDPKWHGVKRTPANWDEWGRPWTCGWGETKGVKEGDVWTQEYADLRRDHTLAVTLLGVYQRCPQLHLEPPARMGACVSLAYNIGLAAFGASSVCRKTRYRDYEGAAQSFLLWNKAGGRVMRGLTRRREAESNAYINA